MLGRKRALCSSPPIMACTRACRHYYISPAHVDTAQSVMGRLTDLVAHSRLYLSPYGKCQLDPVHKCNTCGGQATQSYAGTVIYFFWRSTGSFTLSKSNTYETYITSPTCTNLLSIHQTCHLEDGGRTRENKDSLFFLYSVHYAQY